MVLWLLYIVYFCTRHSIFQWTVSIQSHCGWRASVRARNVSNCGLVWVKKRRSSHHFTSLVMATVIIITCLAGDGKRVEKCNLEVAVFRRRCTFLWSSLSPAMCFYHPLLLTCFLNFIVSFFLFSSSSSLFFVVFPFAASLSLSFCIFEAFIK